MSGTNPSLPGGLRAARRWYRARRVLPGESYAGARLVALREMPLYAAVSGDATPSSVYAALLGSARDVLQAAGLQIVALPAGPVRTTFAVLAEDGEQVARALSSLPAGFYLGRSTDEKAHSLVPAGQALTQGWRTANVILVAKPVTDPEGRTVLGVDDGLRVQIWRRGENGWVTGVSNRWTRELPFDGPWDATVDVAGVELPTHEMVTHGHVNDPSFPIDVVYTWVDGQDPEWRRRMTAARDGVDVSDVRAVADARFESLDELRYSLRALDAYAPWVRKVWLVTDRQAPEWLVQDDKLQVVDHRDIWSDPSLLPVFNSHAIESQLHHIDGLAEHYVYLNDDVLLMRPLLPSDFFSPGGVAYIHPSGNRIGLDGQQPTDSAPAKAMKLNRALLLPHIGAAVTTTFWHVPHPQRRSVQYELEEMFAEDFRRTAGSRFRSDDDVSPISLGHWFGYRTGRAVKGGMVYKYADIVNPEGMARLREILDWPDIEVVCVNQSEDPAVDREQLRDLVRAELEGHFPFRSRWEKRA